MSSCIECERRPTITTIKMGNGHVKLIGCHDHLIKLLEKLKLGVLADGTL